MSTDHACKTDNTTDRRGTISLRSVDGHADKSTPSALKMGGSIRAEASTGMAALPDSAAPLLSDTLSGCTSTSMTTALIILVAAIVGTALVSSTITWLIFRRRYAKYRPKKQPKQDALSVETPGQPQWGGWARSAPQQLARLESETGQESVPVAVAVNISPAQLEADGSVLPVTQPEADLPTARRRPEYASGLSSTFMFPRGETGVTVTIMSDAPGAKKGGWIGKSRRQVPYPRTAVLGATSHRAVEMQSSTTSPTSPSAPLDISSTDRLVVTEELANRTTDQQTRTRRGTSRKGHASSSPPSPDENAPKSAIAALRERLQASHAAAAAAAANIERAESPAPTALAPNIPKRSSLRTSAVPPVDASSGAQPADDTKPRDKPSGFPENSIHTRGKQQPFVSAIRQPPSKPPSQPPPPPPVLQRPRPSEGGDDQRRPSTPEGRPSTSDRRPSTSETVGSPDRPGSRRTPRRPRKGTLVMFPKITDGPPPSAAAGIIKPQVRETSTDTTSVSNAGPNLDDPELYKSSQVSQQQQES